MFRSLTCLLIAWMCICLGACSSVTTTQLIGEPVDDAQGAKLNGVWNGGSDTLIFAHYLQDGKVQIGSTKWDDTAKKFKMEQDVAYVRSVGGAMILHLADQHDASAGGKTTYSLSRLIITEAGDIIYMPPDVKRFAEAVAKGELKGSTTGAPDNENVDGFAASKATNVDLTSTKAEIDAYLTKDRIALLFTLDGSGVLRRVEGIDIDN